MKVYIVYLLISIIAVVNSTTLSNSDDIDPKSYSEINSELTHSNIHVKNLSIEIDNMKLKMYKNISSNTREDLDNFFINITNDMNINEEGYVQTYEFKFPNENDIKYKLFKMTITKYNEKHYEIDKIEGYDHNIEYIKPQNNTINGKHDDINNCNVLREFISNITKCYDYEELVEFLEEILNECVKSYSIIKTDGLYSRSFHYDIIGNNGIYIIKYLSSFNDDNTKYFISKERSFNIVKNQIKQQIDEFVKCCMDNNPYYPIYLFL